MSKRRNRKAGLAPVEKSETQVAPELDSIVNPTETFKVAIPETESGLTTTKNPDDELYQKDEISEIVQRYDDQIKDYELRIEQLESDLEASRTEAEYKMESNSLASDQSKQIDDLEVKIRELSSNNSTMLEKIQSLEMENDDLLLKNSELEFENMRLNVALNTKQSETKKEKRNSNLTPEIGSSTIRPSQSNGRRKKVNYISNNGYISWN